MHCERAGFWSHYPISSLPVKNLWHPTLAELDELGSALLGNSQIGWVRRGNKKGVIIQKRRNGRCTAKPGCVCGRLEIEFQELMEQVGWFLSGEKCSIGLAAAAFFHLRFEYIHPLLDGNGRVGRWLLAAQLSKAYEVPFPEISMEINSRREQYINVFTIKDDYEKFMLLFEMLAIVAGIDLNGYRPEIPFSFRPKVCDEVDEAALDAIVKGRQVDTKGS